MTEQRTIEEKLYTPWGLPYYGPVERVGDLLTFWHEGKKYPLRPEFVRTTRDD